MSTRQDRAEGSSFRIILRAAAMLTAAGLPLFAQTTGTVGTVTVSGNETISAERLLPLLPVRPGAGFTDSLLNAGRDMILRVYGEESFYGAEVVIRTVPRADGGPGSDVSYLVSEGDRTAVAALSLVGCGAVDAGYLLGLFETGPGTVLDPRILESDIARVLETYDDAGYPLASVSVGGIIPGEEGGTEGLLVTLMIDEGPPVEIVEMKAEGNTATRTDVILRESRISPPEPYNRGKLLRFRERLRRMGIFSTVEEPVLYSTGRGAGILVRVSEGRTSTFDGIVGYVPGSGAGEGGSVTGMARVAVGNLFGTGRKFEAQWSRDRGPVQEIRLMYEEPWLLGYPFNLAGRFFQRQQDSSFVERVISGELVFMASGALTVSGVVEGRRVIPSETAGPGAPGNSSTLGGGLVLRLDTRDDRWTPRKGVSYETRYTTGSKRRTGGSATDLPADAKVAVRNLGMDVDVFFGTFRNQVLNLGFHARQLWSPQPETGDLYRLGGYRGLRGFRENRFLGSRMAWSVVEYRFLSAGRSFFYGFFDTGYIYSPLAPPAEDLTYGYGVGMRFETALGLVSVSFALGEGDPVSQAKLHFGLVNDF